MTEPAMRRIRRQRLIRRHRIRHPSRARDWSQRIRRSESHQAFNMVPASAGHFARSRTERLGRLRRAHRAGHRADNPGLATARDVGLVGRFFKETAQASGGSGEYRHRLPRESEHATINEGNAELDTYVVNEELGRGTVVASDHEIEARNDFGGRWRRPRLVAPVDRLFAPGRIADDGPAGGGR